MMHDGFLQSVTESDARCEALMIDAERVLDSLAAELATVRQQSRPAALRKTRARATLVHPGGGVTRSLDPVVLTTPEKMYLLHGGYVHPNTRCTLELNTHWGTREEVAGSACACVHVSGSVHALELRLDAGFDLARFVKGYRAPEPEGTAPVDPASIRGRVIIVDDQELDAQMIGAHLRATSLEPQVFQNLARALEQVRQRYTHLVICDAHLEPGKSEGIVSILRSAGHRGAIVLLVSELRQVRTPDTENLPPEAILHKPFTREQLLDAVIAQTRGEQSAALPAQIMSSMAGRSDLSELIGEFVKSARKLRDEMHGSIGKDEVDSVRDICRQLRESGGVFGFDLLSTSAGAALKAIDASMAIHESLKELDTLAQVIDRLQEPAADPSDQSAALERIGSR